MDLALPQQESPPAPSQGQDAVAKGRPDLHPTLPGQPFGELLPAGSGAPLITHSFPCVTLRATMEPR